MKLARWLQLVLAMACAGAAAILAAHYQVSMRPRADLFPLINGVVTAVDTFVHWVRAPFR